METVVMVIKNGVEFVSMISIPSNAVTNLSKSFKELGFKVWIQKDDEWQCV